MATLDLLALNLLSPMVLCFVLGAIAGLLKSDLSLPESVYTALSTYLLLAIGLKGGVALSKTPIGEMLLPGLATLCMGCLVPLLTFAVTRYVGRLDIANAAALAAHYGSVSAVTFIASLAFLETASEPFEGYLPALVALLEVPAIFVGLLLARPVLAGGATLRATVHEIVTGKSIMLLVGGMAIGTATGERGYAAVTPFFEEPFQGALCLFLLDMGLLAAIRLGELRSVGVFLVAFALLAPLLHGTLGVTAGLLAGMSVGGATVLGTLSASASYIAAPAAVRIALPQANPSLYLTAAVSLTFPFNLAVGIPIYYALAQVLAGS